ncbi:hypothetical protein B7463_g6623, partial [Scytalidium lignicola]
MQRAQAPETLDDVVMLRGCAGSSFKASTAPGWKSPRRVQRSVWTGAGSRPAGARKPGRVEAGTAGRV